jgi:hypothetical protein
VAVSVNLRRGPEPRFFSAAMTSGSDGFTYPSGPLGTKPPPLWPPLCLPPVSPVALVPGCAPDPEWEPDPVQAARAPEPAATIEAPSKVRRVCVCMTE